MGKFKITVEEEGKEKKEFEFDEYWLFGQKNEGDNSFFQNSFVASKLFRSHVQSHVTLTNITEHLEKIKDSYKGADE